MNVLLIAVVANAVTGLTPSKAELKGYSGLSADTCIRARAYSDWARGPMYEECVNSFRTHWDDTVAESGWQNEYWGKTMLCFAGAARYTGDEQLKAWIVEKTHAFLDEFQKSNGYLSTYSKEDFLRAHPENPDASKHWCFNIWGRKYTLWALVEIHRVTGDHRAIEGAEKMLDHLIAQLKRLNLTIDKTGAWHGVSSMSILRPVLELYRLTAKSDYLDFAKEIVAAMDSPPYTQSDILHDAYRKGKICSWYPEPGFWAKAYEIQSCLEGLVDYYRLTGEKSVLDGVLAYYGHLVREEMNPMRSAGLFDHFFNAADQLSGLTELCDVTHWIRLNRELLLATGEARYADRIEEAFYNAFLAGVTRDGRWGAHIVKSHGTRHLWAPPQTGMFYHQCCPDNMMRTYFDFADSVAAVDTKGTVRVCLYSEAVAELSGARLSISGGYPYSDGPIVVTIDRAKAGRLAFRIPAWSSVFTLNGKLGEAKGGWCEVDAPAGVSSWTLGFDYSPRISPTCMRARQMPPAPVNRSRSDVDVYTTFFMGWHTPEMMDMSRSTPAVSVMRGPLVLAKGRLAGTARGDTFFAFSEENGRKGWNLILRSKAQNLETLAVPRVWTLTMSRGAEERSFPVSDFASLSNVNEPDNWFSIWF